MGEDVGKEGVLDIVLVSLGDGEWGGGSYLPVFNNPDQKASPQH